MISGDNQASNGVIHVIDSLLFVGKKSLSDILATDTRLRTFSNLVSKSISEAYLKGSDDMTLFAPTDEAFGSLPTEMITNLVLDPGKLNSFVLQHLHKGALYTNSLRDGIMYGVRPVQGKVLLIERKQGGDITINSDSKIIVKDIKAANGVLHIVDKVMLPKL